ncbi:exonuclease domain-containing protein, partial [Turicimonas muris]|uniref:exonuclease domain-containing protein n=1 Tax=Turicimonas muris TaxID=1796652 RepID=UPI002631F0D1
MSGFMPEIPRSALFNEDNLIWMDLEMTGLEPQVNRILEMAAVITDPQLNVIAERSGCEADETFGTASDGGNG